MIVRNKSMIVTDITSLQYTNNANGEHRYGIIFHNQGGSFVTIRTGSEDRTYKIVETLSDILIDEHMTRARTDNKDYEYIVILADDNSKVVSKQLLTEDKVEKFGWIAGNISN